MHPAEQVTANSIEGEHAGLDLAAGAEVGLGRNLISGADVGLDLVTGGKGSGLDLGAVAVNMGSGLEPVGDDAQKNAEDGNSSRHPVDNEENDHGEHDAVPDTSGLDLGAVAVNTRSGLDPVGEEAYRKTEDWDSSEHPVGNEEYG